MVLVISGNFDPIEVLRCIKENQINKVFSKSLEVTKSNIAEPRKVKRKRKIKQRKGEFHSCRYF